MSTTSETVVVKTRDKETPWPEPRTFRNKPYLTRVTVAGDRLSDLIEALRQFDPDTKISIETVQIVGSKESNNVIGKRVAVTRGITNQLL